MHLERDFSDECDNCGESHEVRGICGDRHPYLPLTRLCATCMYKVALVLQAAVVPDTTFLFRD